VRPALQPPSPCPRQAYGRRGLARVRNWRHLAGVAFLLLLAALAALGAAAPESSAAAPSTPDPSKGTGFAITRHVIAGGGGTSSSGVFVIRGTIGQADADPLQPATGGVFAISGGFWPGVAPAAPASDVIFANGFEPATP